MKSLCVIPCKGVSRRLPGKNIRDFHGMPIMAYSVLTARWSGLFEHICVSTDSHEVADIALKYHAQVVWRPGELAEHDGAPDCGTQEVARHAVQIYSEHHDVRFACCLYATAPLVTPHDLEVGFYKLGMHDNRFVYAADVDGADAGQWYWGTARAFLDRVPLQGNSVACRRPPDRVCDINTQEDWDRALELYQRLRGEKWTGILTGSGRATSATPTPTATK